MKLQLPFIGDIWNSNDFGNKIYAIEKDFGECWINPPPPAGIILKSRSFAVLGSGFFYNWCVDSGFRK